MKKIFKFLLAVTFFSFATKVKAITNIKVGNYSLVPYFSEYITKYNVFVNDNEENVDISVSKSDDDDYVTGIGNVELIDGKTEIILKVIKKNEEILTYQIDIFKNYKENSDLDDVSLTKLIINGYDINFNPDVHEYNVNVLDDNRLDIDYETKSSEARVKITGNSNFKEGKNEVRIIVNNKDKSKTNLYLLNVNKVITTFEEEPSVEIVENNILGREKLTKKETNILTLSVISICSIIIIFLFYMLFVFNRKRIT